MTIDAREPDEFRSLFEEMDDVESVSMKRIPTGDFVVTVDEDDDPVVFERKTPSDFIASMKNRRLETQINSMYETFSPERSFLLIEGDMEDFDFMAYSQFSAKSVRGFLASLSARWQCVPLFCTDKFHLADIVCRVSRKCVEDTDRVVRSPDATPNTKNPDFYDRALLQLDGVGPGTKEKLKAAFPSLDDLVSARRDDLERVDGIGSGKSRKIMKQVNDD